MQAHLLALAVELQEGKKKSEGSQLSDTNISRELSLFYS